MILASLGVLLSMSESPSCAAQRLDLDLASSEWDISTKGAFTVHLDRRGVLTMSHADVPAHNGEFGAISRTVDLPQDRTGPLVLRFYLTDDYCGDKQQATYFRDAVKDRISDWKEEVRFCEVLLDDVVVWSKDVIGRNGTTPGERFYDLEISDFVKDKKDVALVFRVKDTADTEDATFATDVFWARPELLWGFGDTPPPVEFPPRLPFRREKFRPTAPPAPLSGSTSLTVRNPTDVSLDAWPIRWGVPFPQGAVTEATHVALQDPAGKPVLLQTQLLARWPDGSAKWLLLDFVAPLKAGDTPYRLDYGASVSAAVASVGAASAAMPFPLSLSGVAIRDGREVVLRAPLAAAGTLSAGGPVCREVRESVDCKTDDGWCPLRADLSARAYVGFPGILVRHTVEVGGAKGGVALRELAVTIGGPSWATRSIGVGGVATRLEGTPCEVRQADQDTIVMRGRDPGSSPPTAGCWDGWAISGDGKTLVCLRWPWQQAPVGLRSGDAGETLLLLAASERLALAPGEAKTWEYMGWADDQGLSAEKAIALNAVYQKPPVVVLEPGWVAATAALGPFLEQDERRFPEYEAAAARLAPDVLAQRERQKAYGFENFGDLQFGWGFGEALTYWQNTEYDYAHALFWQFLRTGDPECFYAGEQAVLHYRDVDLIHANDEHPDWTGGAHHHSETHTGHGPSISHHWTEGLFDHWLLTGDTRSLECGQQAAEYAARVALASGYGGGEREAGWNLIALMGAYRATGDDAMLKAAAKKVDDVLAYLDPVRGVSSAPIFEQTAYEGGTPFMAAILMRGLTAYYEATKDERVGWAICGLCDWMACEMMPAPGRFFYKQTPQCHSVSSQLLAVDGTAFAWNFTGDPVYRQLALDVYRQGVGTASLTNVRDMPHALALLTTALPPVALASVERPFLTPRAADPPPTATFSLRNLSGEAEQAEIRLTATDSAARQSVSVAVPDNREPVAAKIALPIRERTPGAQRFAYEVVCRDEGVAQGELASLVVADLPRVLLLAPPDNLTTRSLDLLGIPYRRADMSGFTPALLTDADVLICGFDVDRAPLEAHAQALAEWVRGGKVILGFRDSSGHNGWLPAPVKQDASYQPGELLQPDAAPFRLLHEVTADTLRAVHGGSMYSAFYDLGVGWQPLASAGEKQAWDKTDPASAGPHYGLIQLRLGKGRILLSQLIPEYAWLNDDAAAHDSAGRLLLENLVAYACLSAG
ncbi:MAG: hypothetical protein FJX75_09745 [Armatimonadetes bacterium]|nr:hypothetical protein [Armatimonadota bacterium]